MISNSSDNSAIDTEQGYYYTGRAVIAVMPSRSMTNEATHCDNFSSIATKSNLTFNSGNYLNVTVGGEITESVEIPDSISAAVIHLGSKFVKLESLTSTSAMLDDSGVFRNN